MILPGILPSVIASDHSSSVSSETYKYLDMRTMWKHSTKSVYPKCHFIFLTNWNTKLEIEFWFSFLYWTWHIKYKTNFNFFNFQNNRTLKFKLEFRFSFFILIWKTKNQIFLNKYLIKLVTRSYYAFTINKYKRIKQL